MKWGSFDFANFVICNRIPNSWVHMSIKETDACKCILLKLHSSCFPAYVQWIHKIQFDEANFLRVGFTFDTRKRKKWPKYCWQIYLTEARKHNQSPSKSPNK